MANNSEQQYFYTVSILDLHNGLGHTLPRLPDHALAFQASAQKARGILFAHGYNLESEKGLFTDNKARFISEEYDTTDGSNSTENDIPDRLSILVKDHPLMRVYGPDMRFGKLQIDRFIVPKMGGASRRLQGRRRRMTRRSKQNSRV